MSNLLIFAAKPDPKLPDPDPDPAEQEPPYPEPVPEEDPDPDLIDPLDPARAPMHAMHEWRLAA